MNSDEWVQKIPRHLMHEGTRLIHIPSSRVGTVCRVGRSIVWLRWDNGGYNGVCTLDEHGATTVVLAGG